MGLNLERKYSEEIHLKNIPFLISAKFLRSCQCGQIDVATISTQEVTIYEIKTSLAPSRAQQMRLRRSAELVSSITALTCRLIFITGNR